MKRRLYAMTTLCGFLNGLADFKTVSGHLRKLYLLQISLSTTVILLKMLEKSIHPSTMLFFLLKSMTASTHLRRLYLS
jgi:hypothetical protein